MRKRSSLEVPIDIPLWSSLEAPIDIPPWLWLEVPIDTSYTDIFSPWLEVPIFTFHLIVLFEIVVDSNSPASPNSPAPTPRHFMSLFASPLSPDPMDLMFSPGSKSPRPPCVLACTSGSRRCPRIRWICCFPPALNPPVPRAFLLVHFISYGLIPSLLHLVCEYTGVIVGLLI